MLPIASVVFGNCNGIAMVDYLQKAVLLNLSTIELYGSNDPYRREPRSPRKSRQPSGGKKKGKPSCALSAADARMHMSLVSVTASLKQRASLL